MQIIWFSFLIPKLPQTFVGCFGCFLHHGAGDKDKSKLPSLWDEYDLFIVCVRTIAQWLVLFGQGQTDIVYVNTKKVLCIFLCLNDLHVFFFFFLTKMHFFF